LKLKLRLAAFLLLFVSCIMTVPVLAVPAVSAESAVLMEKSSRAVVMDKNAHRRMPMASTTKIMTALVALENCEDLSAVIQVSEKAVGIEGSSVYLKAGEPLTMEQLLYALLLESANDAAAAIAVEIAGDIPAFADMMNTAAQRIGLTDTHFTNPHGLDDENHYTTAYDLALLTCYALENPVFRRISSTYKTTIPMNNDEGTRVLINHNRLLKTYDGAIGVKTGYTRRCGRCLVSAAERDGVAIIAVTLSAPDDWADHSAMLDYGFSQYASVHLADAGEYQFDLPCLGAEEETVTVSNKDSAASVLPVSHGPITVTVEANRYLCAPVEEGMNVGTLVFRCDNKILAQLALTADTAAQPIQIKKSAADRLREMLRIS